MQEKLFEETSKVRDAIYDTLGKVDSDVIAHAINPAFMGGPRWPSLRQAFSVIRKGDSTIVISNGLSDPFDDEEDSNPGFGLEILAETKISLPDNIADSWLFNLVYAVAREAACAGDMAGYLSEYGIITREFYAEDCGLEELQGPNGTIGVIIGVEHPDLPKNVEFPGGKVILATVQLLTPVELDFVIEKRAEGRDALHSRMKESGLYHYVDPNRESLVTAAQQQEVQLNATTENNEFESIKPWWKFWA